MDILVQIQGFQNMRQPQACIKSFLNMIAAAKSRTCSPGIVKCHVSYFHHLCNFPKKTQCGQPTNKPISWACFFFHTSHMINMCKWSMVYWADHVRIQELLCLVACQTLTGHSLKPDFWFSKDERERFVSSLVGNPNCKSPHLGLSHAQLRNTSESLDGQEQMCLSQNNQDHQLLCRTMSLSF